MPQENGNTMSEYMNADEFREWQGEAVRAAIIARTSELERAHLEHEFFRLVEAAGYRIGSGWASWNALPTYVQEGVLNLGLLPYKTMLLEGAKLERARERGWLVHTVRDYYERAIKEIHEAED